MSTAEANTAVARLTAAAGLFASGDILPGADNYFRNEKGRRYPVITKRNRRKINYCCALRAMECAEFDATGRNFNGFEQWLPIALAALRRTQPADNHHGTPIHIISSAMVTDMEPSDAAIELARWLNRAAQSIGLPDGTSEPNDPARRDGSLLKPRQPTGRPA